MYQGKLVFAQVMAHLLLSTFRRCVARYNGEHKVKSFSCLDQFYAMAFAQLTFRESLRDIEACLATQGKQPALSPWISISGVAQHMSSPPHLTVACASRQASECSESSSLRTAPRFAVAALLATVAAGATTARAPGPLRFGVDKYAQALLKQQSVISRRITYT